MAMLNDACSDAPRDERAAERADAYERPQITDHGTLSALTLSGGGNFTDGMGSGGNGS